MTGHVPGLQSPKLTSADPFTEPWLCNPALGLASLERVLSSLGTAEGSPESPVEGPITGPPLDVGDPSFGLSHAEGPTSEPPALGYVTRSVPQPRRPAVCTVLALFQPFLSCRVNVSLSAGALDQVTTLPE
jgi:hypothetical protein